VNHRSRIFIAGGGTLLGASLRDLLLHEGYRNLVGLGGDEPDLNFAAQVEDFFAEARPQFVFLVGGKSGGIERNRSRPADLMLDNLLAAAHVIDAAHRYGVKKLLYLASSCSYPRLAPQPMAVESLMTGPLEPTSAPYATAKLSGWQLCDAYRRQHADQFVTAFPGNSFGLHDDFSLEGGHVIPALLRRAHRAKRNGEPSLTVWGTGSPRREFLYAKDLASACLFVMRRYDGPEPINLGGGQVLSIAQVARAVAQVVGYRGALRYDASKPDGTPLKVLDSRPLRELGWKPSTPFRTALSETYTWFLQHEVKEDFRDVPAAV
jgi:GDP-L-fucose synthase